MFNCAKSDFNKMNDEIVHFKKFNYCFNHTEIRT